MYLFCLNMIQVIVFIYELFKEDSFPVYCIL